MAMTQYSSYLSLFFLVTYAILFTSLTGPAHCGICDKADYKPLCNSVVKRVNEPRAAVETMINNLVGQINHAMAIASRRGKDDKVDTCLQNYNAALDDLQKSMQFLKANDFGSLSVRLSAVISDLESCNDAYDEQGEKSPFCNTNTNVEHATDNALLVAQEIAN